MSALSATPVFVKCSTWLHVARRRLSLFKANERAAAAVAFTVASIPALGAVGVAVDYAHLSAAQTKLRAGLDGALLNGATQAASARDAAATQTFDAQKPTGFGTIGTPTFTTSSDSLQYSGSVTATIQNQMMQLLGMATTDLTVTATAAMPVFDQSCILTLGQGLAAGTDSMTFNGGSNLNLTACTLHSNTSMTCNGSDVTNASYAVGIVSKCANPHGHSIAIPDIYDDLASNISRQCGAQSFNNLSWTSTDKPSSPKLLTVTASGRTEYHVCGSLTVSGTGTLTGTSDSQDSIIVIENGSLTVASDAAISASRTAFVFTAGTSSTHTINFPQGNGHSASLTISPPRNDSDPWKGVAMYQDPSLTTNVDLSWGPGASLTADGVLYFPNANMTMSGSGASNNSSCTKLVVNTLTTNGSFNFSQSDTGCDYINMQQYTSPARLLY